MREFSLIFLMVWLTLSVNSLPVQKDDPEGKVDEKQDLDANEGDAWENNLEYGRYLKEVVQALESDPAFRKKLETADTKDIKTGKIARELNFVDHNIRTTLDELKRQELERLRHLAIKEHEKEVGVDRNKLKAPIHIDHKNPTRFEVEDLRKLIMKTTQDLEKIDDQRKEEFKNYEMEKEFERQQELAGLDVQHRQEAEQKHNIEEIKHKQHPNLHHPGSKQQLEEVWEEQDHLSKEDFNPKTFFHLHDLDGNGFWDETEVKALFQKELDKMYDAKAPEDDLLERYEEMERMREHVFRESDKNRDGLISFQEFIDQTKQQDFERDEGWRGLDEQEAYSRREYEEYERQKQEEIRKLVESGAIPPPPGYYGYPPPGPMGYQQVYQNMPQGYQNVPLGYAGQGYPQQGQNMQYQVVPGHDSQQGGQYQKQQPPVHNQQQMPAQRQQFQQVPVQNQQFQQPPVQNQQFQQPPGKNQQFQQPPGQNQQFQQPPGQNQPFQQPMGQNQQFQQQNQQQPAVQNQIPQQFPIQDQQFQPQADEKKQLLQQTVPDKDQLAKLPSDPKVEINAV